jgi:hypothetical protein
MISHSRVTSSLVCLLATVSSAARGDGADRTRMAIARGVTFLQDDAVQLQEKLPQVKVERLSP